MVLSLQTLDEIYVGVYEDNIFKELITIQPTTLDYNLQLQLEDNQEVYYFYNQGFGQY